MRYFTIFTIFLKITLVAKMLTFYQGEYKIVDFENSIKDIKISNPNLVQASFDNNDKNIFKKVRFFAKAYGSANMIVTYQNSKTEEVSFQVIKNIGFIEKAIHEINPSITVKQFDNSKIILKGDFKNEKEKSAIYQILSKASVDTTADLIDMSNTKEPPIMIEIKLYTIEVNNKKGYDYKNNLTWALANNAATETLDIVSGLTTPITLSGGLSAAATKLGTNFSASAALSFMESKNIASVLDETTLLVVENNKAEFLSGGIIFIETQTTSAEGLPVSAIQEINFGISLDIKANSIIDNRYVDMQIDTSVRKPDWANAINNIPPVSEKSIKTHVIGKDKETIILSGLVNSDDSELTSKVPLLGDLPILGKLFRSESFKNGNSEMMFFIIPTIVHPVKSN